MGEYAEYALEAAFMRGVPVDPRPPRRRKIVQCPRCEKECRGIAGLMQHANAKHGAAYTWAEIDRSPVEYEKMQRDVPQ